MRPKLAEDDSEDWNDFNLKEVPLSSTLHPLALLLHNPTIHTLPNASNFIFHMFVLNSLEHNQLPIIKTAQHKQTAKCAYS